jgi:hypothetical protein
LMPWFLHCDGACLAPGSFWPVETAMNNGGGRLGLTALR